MPWEELAAYAESVVPDGVNVYATASPQIVTPAVVIRPDQPWREPSGATFCTDVQRYVAVAVVSASTPGDGTRTMYRIHNSIIRDLPEGWAFESIGALVIDESTGSQLLASALRLTYRNDSLEEEES